MGEHRSQDAVKPNPHEPTGEKGGAAPVRRVETPR